MPLDVDAMAAEVVLLMKRALAPVLVEQAAQQARIAVLETRPAVPEIAPEDIAASLAGLLRKELADLDIKTTRTAKRIVRNDQGQIERVIEEPI